MAKNDLVFESDRIERRNRLRLILIPLAILLVIIAIVVVIAVIRGKEQGKLNSGGTDSSFPYTWSVNNRNQLTITIDRSSLKDGEWTLDPESLLGGNEVFSEEYQVDQQAEQTEFVLTPTAAGRTVLDFLLKQKADGVTAYSLSMMVEVTTDRNQMNIDILSSQGRTEQGTITGGEGTDYPYAIYRNEAGDLIIDVYYPGSVAPVEEVDEEAAFEAFVKESNAPYTEAAPAESGEETAEEGEQDQFLTILQGIDPESPEGKRLLELVEAAVAQRTEETSEETSEEGTEETSETAEPSETSAEEEGENTEGTEEAAEELDLSSVPEELRPYLTGEFGSDGYDPFAATETEEDAEDSIDLTAILAEVLGELPENLEVPYETEETVNTWKSSTDFEDIAQAGETTLSPYAATAVFSPGSGTGRCNVRMYSEEEGVEITVECRRKEDGDFLVTSHTIKVNGK